MIGLGLAVLQQLTGINAIIYYSNSIFAAAGYATPAEQAQATTWGIGAVNVLSTFIAIAFIDGLGRRPLLIAGLIGMALSLAVVGFAFWQSGTQGRLGSSAGVITLVALVAFIISFAFSAGPVTWTVINEIYPNEIRGRAVAVATAVNWGAAFLVSAFFLSLVHAIGQAYTFWLFAAFCVIGLDLGHRRPCPRREAARWKRSRRRGADRQAGLSLAADNRLESGPHALTRIAERGRERLEVRKAARCGDAALHACRSLGGIEWTGGRQAHELCRVGIKPVRVNEDFGLFRRDQARAAASSTTLRVETSRMAGWSCAKANCRYWATNSMSISPPATSFKSQGSRVALFPGDEPRMARVSRAILAASRLRVSVCRTVLASRPRGSHRPRRSARG